MGNTSRLPDYLVLVPDVDSEYNLPVSPAVELSSLVGYKFACGSIMDYDALKDQWSEIEDRDGVRLSWNTFPSSRMVNPQPALSPSERVC